jgi:transposase
MEQNRKKTSKPYSPEFRERAVRLVAEHRDEYRSDAAAHAAIASKLGCSPDSLREWVRQAQRDGGERPGQTSVEKARLKELERENRELRQANEILKKGETIFRHWSEDNGRTLILPRIEGSAASLRAMPEMLDRPFRK